MIYIFLVGTEAAICYLSASRYRREMSDSACVL